MLVCTMCSGLLYYELVVVVVLCIAVKSLVNTLEWYGTKVLTSQ